MLGKVARTHAHRSVERWFVFFGDATSAQKMPECGVCCSHAVCVRIPKLLDVLSVTELGTALEDFHCKVCDTSGIDIIGSADIGVHDDGVPR